MYVHRAFYILVGIIRCNIIKWRWRTCDSLFPVNTRIITAFRIIILILLCLLQWCLQVGDRDETCDTVRIFFPIHAKSARKKKLKFSMRKTKKITYLLSRIAGVPVDEERVRFWLLNSQGIINVECAHIRAAFCVQGYSFEIISFVVAWCLLGNPVEISYMPLLNKFPFTKIAII